MIGPDFRDRRVRAALLAAAALVICAVWFAVSSEREPVALTIWHVYGSDSRSPFTDAVRDFNATRGAELGIVVTVASILGAETIDAPLVSSANGEPGAPPAPDMFTAYPRAALLVGTERLLDWGEYLTQDELIGYLPEFLSDGLIDGRQLGLPIAKSVTSLFVNRTALDRFLAESGLPAPDLSSWEGLFALGREYSRATGRAMIHFNDYYTYFLALTASDGGFISLSPGSGSLPDGRLDLTSGAFARAFMPLAEAAAHGAINTGEGFGSEYWMTEEIIASVGSSAGLLYMRDFVVRPDGSREPIETLVRPFPPLSSAEPAVASRGSSLWAFDSGDKRRNRAIAEFARWITLGERNMEFATSAGYMPVSRAALDTISSDMEAVIKGERDRSLYRSFEEMYDVGYMFVPLPLYSGVADIQNRFEMAMRHAMSVARNMGNKPGSDNEAAAAAGAAWAALLRDTEDIRK